MANFSENYYTPYQSAKLALRRFVRDRLRLSPKVPWLFRRVRNLVEGARVLDAGCGTGGLLELMERENPRIAAYGVDIGHPPFFLPVGTFLSGSVSELPFVDDRFDVVTCSHVIEHLSDPASCVRELLRVCRPGGCVYLEVPSPRAAWFPFFNVFWDDPTHVRPYSRIGLCRLLEMQGAQVVKSGTKRSLPAVIFGLPYVFIGSLMGDPQAKSMFAIYAFGFSVYAVAEKSHYHEI
ncbi:MAG: class I SAM-dependent methyltransferase [Desulfobulbaceae bacterium]|nr:class I SAM-dependent methyltransferase [Desulfobulbaceae bacterium]